MDLLIFSTVAWTWIMWIYWFQQQTMWIIWGFCWFLFLKSIWDVILMWLHMDSKLRTTIKSQSNHIEATFFWGGVGRFFDWIKNYYMPSTNGFVSNKSVGTCSVPKAYDLLLPLTLTIYFMYIVIDCKPNNKLILWIPIQFIIYCTIEHQNGYLSLWPGQRPLSDNNHTVVFVWMWW